LSSAVLEPQDATSFADLGWAEVFNDPELRTVIETALANNLDLRIAAARVEIPGRVRISRSYYGPEVRGVQQHGASAGTPDDSSYSLGLSLN
jgi:multidrug efflux system outer membrane protein